VFFSEEKNQKTFTFLARADWEFVAGADPQIAIRFCLGE
jgi:hypothetical protein